MGKMKRKGKRRGKGVKKLTTDRRPGWLEIEGGWMRKRIGVEDEGN